MAVTLRRVQMLDVTLRGLDGIHTKNLEKIHVSLMLPQWFSFVPQ